MKYIYFFVIILLQSKCIFPQQKIFDRYLEENCKYPCIIKSLSNDTLKVNIKTLFYSSDDEVLRLDIAEDLSRYFGLNKDSVRLFWVFEHDVEDGRHEAMLKLGNYGLFFKVPYRFNDYSAQNLILRKIMHISLDSEEKVMQYIDFLFRLSSITSPGNYRINKPEDIWYYPQYVFNKFYTKSIKDYIHSGLKIFSKEYMVENINHDSSYIMRKANEFRNYTDYRDTLLKTLKPIKIKFYDNIIIAETFTAVFGPSDIELLKFKFNRSGEILEISVKKVLAGTGYDSGEYPLFLY